MTGTISLQTPRLLLRRHEPEDGGVLDQNFGTDAAMYCYLLRTHGRDRRKVVRRRENAVHDQSL